MIKNTKGEVVFFRDKEESLDQCIKRFFNSTDRFHDIDLRGVDIPSGWLTNGQFWNCDFSDMVFTRPVVFGGCSFVLCNMKGAKFSGLSLYGCNFTDCDMVNSDIRSEMAQVRIDGGKHLGMAVDCNGRSFPRVSDWTGILLGEVDKPREKWQAADQHGLMAQVERADGYMFNLWSTLNGIRICAGCRYFTLPEAYDHWLRSRGGTPLGKETLNILEHFRNVAEQKKVYWA